MHPHDNAEIFTYVISGKLEHKDSLGNGSTIHAGNFQYRVPEKELPTGVQSIQKRQSRTIKYGCYPMSEEAVLLEK